MKRSAWTVAVLAAAALAAAGCDSAPISLPVSGSGNVVEKVRDVAPFERIAVGGAVRLEVDAGPRRVVVVGDDNVVPLVATEVHGKTLRISQESSFSLRSGREITVRVTTPNLAAVEIGGAAKGDVRGVAGPRFEVSVGGAAAMDVAGKTDDLVIKITGAASIDAASLEAKRADVDVSGAGRVKVRATEALSAKVTGLGDIRYAGDPKTVERKILGAGHVEPL
ncbi:MAG: DUF2807 domain-containing protein [Candidatus Polarisedimenticolia bacterium]